ncbi:hypothetical protein [Spirulina sp. 06S082]|uniref:hypothetical protein n=1 Tax=Spirulina sp. 06S082 TaxID=3110248 RepID=UPI002B1FC66F|nr:hypothetical protein [Spirulina sp. 06S082]MEA5467535.1 hypothetical protein [Spirulina sp. 06S082]
MIILPIDSHYKGTVLKSGYLSARSHSQNILESRKAIASSFLIPFGVPPDITEKNNHKL